MTKYLVKSTSVGTKTNPNFAGEIAISYYGKDQKMVGHEGTHYSDMNFPLKDYLIEEYGYNRESDAKRSWIYKNIKETDGKDAYGFWESTVEIIKVEV